MLDDVALRTLPEERVHRERIDEDQRIRRLRATVDLTAAILCQQPLSAAEARALIAATRRTVLALFPGSEGTFDLILAPRFERILRDRGIARIAE